jgi:DNA-binding response OmpR family regulator
MVTTGMGKRILLVEDHQDTAAVFARMLRRDGFDVTIAHNCREAKKLCEDGAFDAVLCDINLPDGNGADVLVAARRCRPDTAGMIVSGHDDDDQRARAREAGFDHFFLKPLNYPLLREALAEVTGT